MSCACNKNNMSGLSGGKNNACAEWDFIPRELAKPNPFIKIIQPKIDKIIAYAKEQINCNLKSIESSDWQKMILSLDTKMLTDKLEPAPFNTIEYAKKEFIPLAVGVAAGLIIIGCAAGYFIGNKKKSNAKK